MTAVPSPTLLRSDIDLLATEAQADLGGLWRETGTVATALPVLRDVLPALVDSYGAAASLVAADWYDESREEVGARGAFTAEPADMPDVKTQNLIGWASGEAVDYAGFRALIEGGTQRRIANFSRTTIVQSSIGDPAARGWKRVGVGSCDFCRLLISRGAVYSEATVDFRAHDHCHCSAAPSWA